MPLRAFVSFEKVVPFEITNRAAYPLCPITTGRNIWAKDCSVTAAAAMHRTLLHGVKKKDKKRPCPCPCMANQVFGLDCRRRRAPSPLHTVSAAADPGSPGYLHTSPTIAKIRYAPYSRMLEPEQFAIKPPSHHCGVRSLRLGRAVPYLLGEEVRDLLTTIASLAGTMLWGRVIACRTPCFSVGALLRRLIC